MSDVNDRGDQLHELYQLMEQLADEHQADDARLDKVDETTAAIVLEFDIPAPPSDDG